MTKKPILHSSLVMQLNGGWQPMEYFTVKKAFIRIFNDAHGDPMRPIDVVLTQDGRISHESVVYKGDDWIELPVRETDDWIGLPHGRRVRVPRLIITPSYCQLPKVTLQFSNKGLFIRDKGVCGYCGVRLTPETATNDHIIPRHQGGQTTWENCVLACGPCNGKKANRTPEQAGMRLRHKAIKPAAVPMKPVLLPSGYPEHAAALRNNQVEMM